MDRTARVKRLTELMELKKRQAKHELSMAQRALADATASADSVRSQCRKLVHDENIPVVFGQMLAHAGTRSLAIRMAEQVAMAASADESRRLWAIEHRRVDALGRLSDRLASMAEIDRSRRVESELDDTANARQLFTAGSNPGSPS